MDFWILWAAMLIEQSTSRGGISWDRGRKLLMLIGAIVYLFNSWSLFQWEIAIQSSSIFQARCSKCLHDLDHRRWFVQKSCTDYNKFTVWALNAVVQLVTDLVRTWLTLFHCLSVTVRMLLRMTMNFERIVCRYGFPLLLHSAGYVLKADVVIRVYLQTAFCRLLLTSASRLPLHPSESNVYIFC